jgi:aspartyl-tRNA(Asn)/glutamyl-tRNA(Gln) amidotransferase subunit C
MPPGFTLDQIEAIAALANLELARSEVDLFARQLEEILAHADQLRQIDTAGVPPTATVVDRGGADRADEVRPSLDLEAALANAPDPALDAGLFKAPRAIG